MHNLHFLVLYISANVPRNSLTPKSKWKPKQEKQIPLYFPSSLIVVLEFKRKTTMCTLPILATLMKNVENILSVLENILIIVISIQVI